MITYSPSELPQFKARGLVVEDNAINQKVAQGLLKKFGVQVDLAADGEKCLAAGMSDFISKPVDPNKLQEALKRWLPKREHEVKELNSQLSPEKSETT